VGYHIHPIPKYLIVDFTLVSGIDTSAIDTFREIAEMCRDRDCRLYLAGFTPDLKSMMLYAGLKPEPGSRGFSYTPDLESALAKAEDSLVTTIFHLEENDEMETSVRISHRSVRNVDDGFLYALQKIDIQHGLHTADESLGSWQIYDSNRAPCGGYSRPTRCSVLCRDRLDARPALFQLHDHGDL
jgi:hypothetical protein